MINLYEFEASLKKNDFSKCYLFCGTDEEMIKQNISKIVKKTINKEYIDLNYIKFDGNKLESFDKILNACETLPLISNKKVVLIYRAEFLGNSKDPINKKIYADFNKYIDNVPEESILIAYYVFKNKREKPSYRINKLDKKCSVVKTDKVIGKQLENKVKELFEKKNKSISNSDLKLFCSKIPNDMGIVKNEVEKLYCYTMGREINRQDINDMYFSKNNDDIFDLVDLIGDKKIKKALETFDELIYRGEDIFGVLYMIERQFRLVYIIKCEVEKGKASQDIANKLKLNHFICKKLINQSKKFTSNQIKKSIRVCLETEGRLKSSSADRKVDLELMLISSIAAN